MNASSSPSSRLRLTLSIFGLMFTALNACSGGGSTGSTPPSTPTLSSITVTADNSSVAAGLTAQFKATGKYSDASTKDLTSSVTWSSASPSVATIDATGLATSKAQGSAVISATSGSVTGSETLTVNPPNVVSITVTSDHSSVAAGLTAQFKATGTFTDSSSKDITAAVIWSSASPDVAAIDASGLATSKVQGTDVISATSGTVSGSETLTVNPPVLASITVNPVKVQIGSPGQMKAVGTYTDQSTQDLSATASWSSSNEYVATVDASGAVTSVSAGLSLVTASYNGLQGTGKLTVLASPRYLYVTSMGRTVTRMPVDGTTGQPRFEGYDRTSITTGIGFPCMTSDPSGTHLYVSNQVTASGGSGYASQVAIYTLDPLTGSLTALPGSPYSIAFPLGCIRFAPSGKFAYSTSGIENAGDQLAELTVNSDATLALNDTISYPYFPTGVVIDPLGKYLYVNAVDVMAGTNAASPLYGYTMDSSTGALTTLDGSPWALATGTYGALAVDPAGNSLYVSDLNATNITQYTLDRSSGKPTKVATVGSTCINPAGLQFLPDGSHAYLTCSQSGSGSVTDAPVVEFAVGSTGQLTVHSSAFAGPVAFDIQVDDSGKFVYVLGSGSDGTSSNAPGNTVLMYQVQTDGSLKLTKQIAGQVQSESMVLVSGAKPVKWKTTNAYATSAGNTVIPYSVGTDGTLTQGTALPTASGPFSASMLPWDSEFVLATHTAVPNLLGVAASGSSLSATMTFGDAASVGGMIIDPGNQWAYATDTAAGQVNVYWHGTPGGWYDVQNGSGGLFTWPAEAGAGPITTDPSGRYLVIANQTAKSISLDEPLGAAPTPAFPLAYTPLCVAVDGTGNLIFVAGDDGQLHMLSSNGQGTLTDVADVALLGANTASIAVDPFTRFVYAAGPSGLNAFAIDGTAQTLTPISLDSSATLANATGVFLDPTGKFLYIPVSSGTTHSMYMFTVNADGTLTASSSAPIATPDALNSLVFKATIQ